MVLLLSPLHLVLEEVWLSEMKTVIIIIHIYDYFNCWKSSGNCMYHIL